MELCISFPIVEKYNITVIPFHLMLANGVLTTTGCSWPAVFLTTSKLMHLHKKLSANIPITQYILAESQLL